MFPLVVKARLEPAAVKASEPHPAVVDLNLEAFLALAVGAARMRAFRAKRPALAVGKALHLDALIGAQVERAQQRPSSSSRRRL
jgi:hypothetical protein